MATLLSSQSIGLEPETRDSVVEHAARQALRASPYGELHGTTCEACDGVLVLRGRVSSFYLKQIAQVITRQLPGVMRLENRLEVTQ